MESILDTLFLPYLSKIGLSPVEDKYNLKRCGICYELDPSIGKGYYWVYPFDNLYAITVCDLIFNCDISLQYEHPVFLSLGYYESSLANLICNRKVYQTEGLMAYIGYEDEYKQTLQKNLPIRSVCINLMPEFYKKILPTKYLEDFRALPSICSRLDGTDTIPEVEMVLKQIRASKPSNHFAQMYYEGKVLEIISLVMQWGTNELKFQSTLQFPNKDLESLNMVCAHIERNYAEQISLDMLTRIACMSSSKLTCYFKQAYGVTITEYVQMIRVKKAKEMLLNSKWGIGEIAHAVGYKMHASFSEVFKRMTGFTPNEFRRKAL